MSQKLFTIVLVVLLALVLAPAALAAPLAQDATGTLVSCSDETGEVVIDTNGDTEGGLETGELPEGATCSDLGEEGDPVSFEGGVVVVDEGDDGSLMEHPVVARIAEQLGMDYDEVWAIFKEGGFTFTPDECTDDPATPEDECADVEPCVDDEATPEDECSFTYDGVIGLGRIMMAIKLEERLTNLDWEWDQLLAYHLEGNGWGQLMQADRLADDEHTAQEILDMREGGCNWGQIRKGECETEGAGLEIQSQGQGQGHGNGRGQGGGRPENPGSNGRGGGGNPNK